VKGGAERPDRNNKIRKLSRPKGGVKTTYDEENRRENMLKKGGEKYQFIGVFTRLFSTYFRAYFPY